MIRWSKFPYGKAIGISVLFHGLLLGVVLWLGAYLAANPVEIIELAPVSLVGSEATPAPVRTLQPQPKNVAVKPKTKVTAKPVVSEPVAKQTMVTNEVLPLVAQNVVNETAQTKTDPTASGPVELGQTIGSTKNSSDVSGDSGGTVGHNTTGLPPDYTQPVAIYNPKPLYPARLSNTGWEGVAIVQIVVKSDGTVGTLTIMESSGNKLADESARQTIKHWRYYPATKEGKPINSYHNVRVRFVKPKVP